MTWHQSEELEPITTRYFRSERKSESQSRRRPSKPYDFSLDSSAEWDTLSKALAKSRKTVIEVNPRLEASVMMSRVSSRFYSHDFLYTNPCC